MEYSARKNIRLKEYNYNKDGLYFLTLCADKKKMIFSSIVNITNEVPICKLSEYGKIVEDTLKKLQNKFNNIELTDYVIMPNHIHFIV